MDPENKSINLSTLATALKAADTETSLGNMLSDALCRGVDVNGSFLLERFNFRDGTAWKMRRSLLREYGINARLLKNQMFPAFIVAFGIFRLTGPDASFVHYTVTISQKQTTFFAGSKTVIVPQLRFRVVAPKGIELWETHLIAKVLRQKCSMAGIILDISLVC